MEDALRRHPRDMYELYFKKYSATAEIYKDEILNYWYDYFLQIYNSQYSISPSLIRYVDKMSSLEPSFIPNILMKQSGEPTRVSEIKRDLMILFIIEELKKGRTLCSRHDEKNGLWLGVELNRRHDWGIPDITDPIPNYPENSKKNTHGNQIHNCGGWQLIYPICYNYNSR